MNSLGNRIEHCPILCKQDGSAIILRKIPLNARQIQEGWLQDLIEKSPEVLPVSEIEPAFTPLISVGKEVPTSVGRIDNLYLSPRGYLTIAETKLWRNPEARRQVVGQIIDYASELSRWSYDDLERYVKTYNRKFRGQDLGILDTLRVYAEIPETEEAAIIDTIARNLQHGRFLLLIVGDGIREDTERMADFLRQTPQLHFTLALAELQLYQSETLGDGAILVVPQVVARTKEIVRAVVRVEGEAAAVHITAELTESGRQPVTLTENEFFHALGNIEDHGAAELARQIIKDMEDRGCSIEWGIGSLKVKLSDPSGSGRKFSLFSVDKNGDVYLGYLLNQLNELGLPEEIASELVRESGKIMGKSLPEPKSGGWWTKLSSLKELQEHYDAFGSVIEKTIERIRQLSSD